MKKPLINILTRTSNRPIGFDINVKSVKEQTYDNINHIIGYDNDEDLNYINKYDGLIKVKVDRESLISADTSPNPMTGKYSPHNLYFNEMMKIVTDGWIIYYDDDDKLAHPMVIEQIVKEINAHNDDTLLIWKFKLGQHIVLPPDISDDNPPSIGRIGGGCIAFHSKYKDLAIWDSWKCGDFRVINKLFNSIPNYKFINKVYVFAPSAGSGNKIDISN